MSMTKILVFSGRKGSGKNTAANYVVGEILRTVRVIHSGFSIAPTGELLVNDIFGNEQAAGVLDIANPKSYEVKQFLEREIYPFVKLYSFADLLKREVCVKILGLTHTQCFGTDAEKNSITHLKWEDMPGVCTDTSVDILIFHEPGYMTARDVMQFVGTNIFRKMYGNVWVDSTIRQIRNESSEIAIITDCRFPNEVKGSKQAGGTVVRLARTPYPEDNHISETALDKNVFDWNEFDIVLENDNSTIPEQNKDVDEIITQLNIVKEV